MLNENFDRFLDYSKRKDIPLIIHSRDAEEEVIEKLGEAEKPAMLHCFSGSVEQAQKAVSLGCLISIPTNITYSRKKQEMVKKIPLDNLVCETDSPYLSPIPKKRNNPINVKTVINKISEIKEISFEDVAGKTAINARKFFSLPNNG